MDDHRAADDFLRRETIGKKDGQRISVIFQKRRQVARMKRMTALSRIKMSSDIRKRIFLCPFAGASLMDMKSKKISTADALFHRKASNLRRHKRTAQSG